MSTKRGLKARVESSTHQTAVAAFTLPDSLQCSEIDIPVTRHQRPKANWNQICEEQNRVMKEIEKHENRNKPVIPKSPFQNTACDFILHEVFNCLLPALEVTLAKAKLWNAYQQHRCFFNGIDTIVQEIWNHNPRHPTRIYDQQHPFNMLWVRKYLAKWPRPLYPKSWLWTDEHAATVIQKTVRQYFVQREPEVAEMRDFWRKLKAERENECLRNNPFLAKELAIESSAFKKPEQSLIKVDNKPIHKLEKKASTKDEKKTSKTDKDE